MMNYQQQLESAIAESNKYKTALKPQFETYQQQIEAIINAPTNPAPATLEKTDDKSGEIAIIAGDGPEMMFDKNRIVTASQAEMQMMFSGALSFAFKSKEKDLRRFLRHMPHLSVMPHPSSGKNEIVTLDQSGKRVFALDIDDRMSLKNLENLFGPQTSKIIGEEVKRQDRFRKLALAGKIAGLVLSAPLKAAYAGLCAIGEELGRKMPEAIKTIATQTMSGLER